MTILTIEQAKLALSQGKIIAYPTEGVYGLGCDPFNSNAVAKLLSLKNRPIEKGLILLISEYAQLDHLIMPLSPTTQDKLTTYWPGPNTLLFYKHPDLPRHISGDHDKIAIRLSNHRVASALAQSHPIVSTSANISGQANLTNADEIIQQFGTSIAGVVAGALGNNKKPSSIIDLETGTYLRQ